MPFGGGSPVNGNDVVPWGLRIQLKTNQGSITSDTWLSLLSSNADVHHVGTATASDYTLQSDGLDVPAGTYRINVTIYAGLSGNSQGYFSIRGGDVEISRSLTWTPSGVPATQISGYALFSTDEVSSTRIRFFMSTLRTLGSAGDYTCMIQIERAGNA